MLPQCDVLIIEGITPRDPGGSADDGGDGCPRHGQARYSEFNISVQSIYKWMHDVCVCLCVLPVSHVHDGQARYSEFIGAMMIK